MKITKKKVIVGLVVFEGVVSILLGMQLRKKSENILRDNGLVKENGVFDEDSNEKRPC